MLNNHFWFDLNQGKSIDASDGSSYHIQHVVRNPKKFGFENDAEMQKHASYPLEDIKDGYRDIDHNLEHHVMSKGFIRGYHTAPSEGWGDGHISFDAATDEHAAHALTHILPMIKAAEGKGKRYDIDMSVGHRGKSPKYTSFSSADQIEQHIGKIAPKGLQSKEPKTFQGVGQVGEPLRKKIKTALRAKDPSAPNWKLEQEVGYSTGTWGDSVEYKNFKQCFAEAMKKMGKKKKW